MTMSVVQQVNEQSTAYLSVRLLDRNGASTVPNSASFMVHDADTGQELVAETAVAASSPLEIVLTPTANSIVKRVNKYETRRVTVVAVFGSGDTLKDQYDYVVRNLAHVAAT